MDTHSSDASAALDAAALDAQTLATLTAYWAAAEARDWAAFGALLTDDVVYELPQTRERILGRERYVQFNREFPGDWHIRVVRATATGRHGATWTSFTVDGDEVPGLSFFDLAEDGRVARVTDFWPEPYPAPTWRAHLVERF